jgi:predicted ATPase
VARSAANCREKSCSPAGGCFLERLAAVGPVVLIIEDAQWADAGLVDFIDYVLDWSADFPLFMLLLARPELADRFPALVAGRGNVTNLRLDPLAPPVIADLLNELVPGMPAAATELVAARAEGVPLFAVELIRSLVDRDVVVPEGGLTASSASSETWRFQRA